MQEEDPDNAAPQEPGQPARQGAGEGEAEAERERQPGHHPEREGAADEPQVAVGEQVLRVPRRVGHVLAAEHPADVRVRETVQRTAPPWRLVDVRAVRVARKV